MQFLPPRISWEHCISLPSVGPGGLYSRPLTRGGLAARPATLLLGGKLVSAIRCSLCRMMPPDFWIWLDCARFAFR